MDTMSAFAMGAATRGNEPRVFDWEKAARRIAEVKPETAGAGLRGDWEYTGDTIWENGAPVPAENAYTYLSSTWAVPELELDGVPEECWRYKRDTDGWDSDTYWPQIALDIVAEVQA